MVTQEKQVLRGVLLNGSEVGFVWSITQWKRSRFCVEFHTMEVNEAGFAWSITEWK